MKENEKREDKIIRDLLNSSNTQEEVGLDYTVKIMEKIHQFEFSRNQKKNISEQLLLGFGGLTVCVIALLYAWQSGYISILTQLLGPYIEPILNYVPMRTLKIAAAIIVVQTFMLRGVISYFLLKPKMFISAGTPK